MPPRPSSSRARRARRARRALRLGEGLALREAERAPRRRRPRHAVVAPGSSSKDAVDDERPASSATGAGVGACQACTNAAAAASCPGVCATGRIFAAAGVEAPPITVTRLFAARASRTTTFAARRSPPRRTIPMRAGGAAAVPQRRAMAFGNIPTRRCTRNPSAGNQKIDCHSLSQGSSRAPYTSGLAQHGCVTRTLANFQDSGQLVLRPYQQPWK